MKSLILIEAHGKIPTWKRISSAIGLEASIAATAGHLYRYPDQLYPLGIKITRGQAIDVSRKSRPDIEGRIQKHLRSVLPEDEIIIATDDDPEGDVIALDIVRTIFDTDPDLIGNCLRIRPGAITREGVERSISDARNNGGGIDDLVSRAVSGRTRALTDRWMGATFSRMSNAGCGRVRAGILGSALCWSKSPDIVRGLPETGEITLQSRSSSGGLPFTAQISLSGSLHPILTSVAQRYAGRLIPGHVSPMKSLSAAVAPRFRDIKPFNTGDALTYAARFHDIRPRVAMAGLQSAYMNGRISYPRTDNRTITESSAIGVVQAARVCGLRDVDISHAAKHSHIHSDKGITLHEGIFPTPRMTKEEFDRFRELIVKPLKKTDPHDRDEVEDLMVTLVSRRAFEALREGAIAPGVFHARTDSDLTPDEIEALSDLEWTRAEGQNVPWSRAQITGLRIWPMSSVIIDGMMIEEIGRPSTLASHADLVEASGQLQIPEPGALPEPSMNGRRILKSLPRGIWFPAACRMIEEAMHNSAPGEGENEEITQRMRRRVDVWFSKINPEVRTALIDILKNEADSGGQAPSKAASVITGSEIDPDMDFSEDVSSGETSFDV